MDGNRFFMQHIDDILREMELTYSRLLNLQINPPLNKGFDKDILSIMDEYYNMTKTFRKFRSNVLRMYYDREDQNILRGEDK